MEPERRSVVASGKTVDDAIKNGLTMLGVRRDQVDLEVLSEGSRGVLGFGAENARVRLLVKAPPAPKAQEPVPVSPVLQPHKVMAPAPLVEPQKKVVTPAPAPEASPDISPPGPDQVGREVLNDLLGLMDIRASIETHASEELSDEEQAPTLVLNLTGEDLGILIGRRGETLRALQYLVRLMVSHRVKHWSNLVIDVENYRVRRRAALEGLALRTAEEVARSGRSQALEPMPADERRIVHITLRNHPKVATHSVGEGERRRVTIIPRR